jgi:hypothetical protein
VTEPGPSLALTMPELTLWMLDVAVRDAVIDRANMLERMFAISIGSTP